MSDCLAHGCEMAHRSRVRGRLGRGRRRAPALNFVPSCVPTSPFLMLGERIWEQLTPSNIGENRGWDQSHDPSCAGSSPARPVSIAWDANQRITTLVTARSCAGGGGRRAAAATPDQISPTTAVAAAGPQSSCRRCRFPQRTAGHPRCPTPTRFAARTVAGSRSAPR